PWIDPESKEMFFSEIQALEALEPGFYKRILEPSRASRTLVDPSEIEIALVPGVAFDRRGARIGMGGGYFDRLLPKMSHAVRIGLAYGCQISPAELPAAPHDVPVHLIVTESEIIEAAGVGDRPIGRFL